MMKTADEDERGLVIAFRAPADLIATVDAAAAAEGISRSAIARRALLRDLRRKEVTHDRHIDYHRSPRRTAADRGPSTIRRADDTCTSGD